MAAGDVLPGVFGMFGGTNELGGCWPFMHPVLCGLSISLSLDEHRLQPVPLSGYVKE